MAKSFANQKENCLSKVDCSRKGVIDLPIHDLCQYINSRDRLFTTSSCSGRIIIFEDEEENGVKKKGCKWLFTTHTQTSLEEMKDALMDIAGEAVFKFEPFVMHVQCQELQDAQNLHSVAVSSGFRNSGITIGKKGKIITAIRSTQGLEVPLSCEGQILISEQYINHIIKIANKKMEENENRIDRLTHNLKASLEAFPSENLPELSKKKKLQNKKRKDPDLSSTTTKAKTEDSFTDLDLSDMFIK
ncbi:TYW3 [Acanthosepion pharaonis]|uniref:tRNA wybutosine-synthesizing protein 3 homolog n=1 Tax=Acanthosepion pharaonis TaxID=158019 RepID=A0A812DMC5_ACAPH|nr:TYW3 [Sepia pharaonis]